MSNSNWIVLPCEGPAYRQPVPEGSSLAELQHHVNGNVEVVQLYTHPLQPDLWVNDEGLYRDDLDHNPVATLLCHLYAPETLIPSHGIRGGAVLALCDEHGDTVGFPEDRIQPLLDVLAKIRS